MNIQHYYDTPHTEEVAQYGKVKFTPINIDFFIRLHDWHEKDFTDVQKALVGEGDKTRSALVLQEVLTAMIHTATYPYLKDTVTSQAWEKTVWGWVLSKPKLMEWFLEYFNSFMPDEKSMGVGSGKSETPANLSKKEASQSSIGGS